MYNALTSLVWSGSAETALFAFDGSLGWTKWAFKAAMVLPYLLLMGYLCQKRSVGPLLDISFTSIKIDKT